MKKLDELKDKFEKKFPENIQQGKEMQNRKNRDKIIQLIQNVQHS